MSEIQNKNRFILKKKTAFTDINESEILPESDLLLTDEKHIYQFEFIRDKSYNSIEVKPGIYSAAEAPVGVTLTPIEFNLPNMLPSVSTAKIISKEMDAFYRKFDVYKELGIDPPKRSILFYSNPGLGKTASIQKAIIDETARDPNIVTVVWPTGKIDASDMRIALEHIFSYQNCSKLILIAEDIGGNATSHEGHSGPREVDTELLNLLEGIGKPFKIPTFIIATTNYPQNLLSALADRPGRFDQMIELLPPSPQEKVDLLKFFMGRDLSEAEMDAIQMKAAKSLSIAHIKEIVIRHRLHDKTVAEIIDEMIAHTERFKEGFESSDRKTGI